MTSTSASNCFEMFGDSHEPIPAVIEATPKEPLVRNDIYDCWPSCRAVGGSTDLCRSRQGSSRRRHYHFNFANSTS